MKIALLIFVTLLTACSKNDGAGGVITSTTYYAEDQDPDGTSVDMMLVVYSNKTFDLYMVRNLNSVYMLSQGSYTDTSVTIDQKTCTTATYTLDAFSTSTNNATLTWGFHGASGNINFSTTKPSGFQEFTAATESCNTASFF